MTHPSRKVCFVTIGATAPFDTLLSNVLAQPFLEALKKHGYTALLIQYGKEGQEIFDTFIKNNPPGSPGRYDLDIQGFGFKKDGLVQEMRSTKANESQHIAEGIILSHAGSGSIMEALRIGVPLVVVPNPALQDNHQEDLTRQIAKNGWAVAGNLNRLAESVPKAEKLRSTLRSWPSKDRGELKDSRGLAGVVEEEMGFLD
ncbi:glycosyltransferase family 28, putative [Talaromyces stipitatus ATCC 10500]|uniref:UDP-N-acetylglucosamine transferase subunit ALG13 n=1 Tax=Talaromyces stipitatus (strain ATCC 10500 / CBS 375.48 / QM 6759 / NRRL 1006) TaxID=441959 RepID=B8M9F4_TALSN|nr:glycosyltransferase family 28, putative [Talaromyces stipitatus ATCC 10500]EED17714.1 glycosyltransferase family 28, putative [Talaromyces stipitatus ATCC 10500]